MSLLPIDFKKYQNEYAIECKAIQEYFRINFNVPVFLVYGTLLGCVQSQSFISFDDDIDLSYMSNKHTAQEVVQEMKMFYEKLNADGLLAHIKNHTGQAWVYSPSKNIMVDMWTSWTDANNKFYCVNWVDGCFHKDSVVPFAIGKLANEKFFIPKQHAQLLQYWYGDWKTPQPRKKHMRMSYYLPKEK